MNRKIYYQLFLLLLFSCSKAEKEIQEDLFFSNTTESTTENSSNIQNTTEDSNNGGTIAEDSTSTTPNEEIEGNGVVTKDGPLEKYLTLNKSITYQKVDGFGAGIKRRTEDLYKLSTSLREKVEKSLPKGLDWDSYYLDEKVNDNMSPKRVVTHCMSPLEVVRKRKEILAKIENCDERFELFCMFVLTPMQLTST